MAEHSNSLGIKILPYEDSNERSIGNIAIQSRPLLTGEMLIDAQATVHNNTPVVNFKLNQMGAKIFGDVTSKNVGKAFAMVLDNVVISAPVIRETILGGSSQISGSFTVCIGQRISFTFESRIIAGPLKSS